MILHIRLINIRQSFINGGNAGAIHITSQNPAIRRNFWCSGRSLIIKIPAMATRKTQAIAMRRDLRNILVKIATRMTIVSWKADAGRPMRIVWYTSYPNPLMIRVWNCGSLACQLC